MNETMTEVYEAAPVDGEWIVQLKGYYPHAKHAALLQRSFDSALLTLFA